MTVRRIVVGLGPDGKSRVDSDGSPSAIFHFRDQSGPHNAKAEKVDQVPAHLAPGEGALAELWSTERAGPRLDGHTDPTQGMTSWQVECPPGGSRFRTSVFSPGRRTAMHTTNTLDYDFVLEGSVTLILSDGSETELSAGDAVVLPGCAHAWLAGPDGCRLGLVMLGLGVAP
jgi:quercetin dioxygenase-like cupin family protein